MAGPYDKYIYCREDTELTDTDIPDGSSGYTSAFELYKDGIFGIFAVYIDSAGSGKINVYYEVDPGNERGESRDRQHTWFVPVYGNNPAVKEMSTGKAAEPMVVTVGRYIRLRIEAVGGGVHINYIKFVIQ